MANGEVPGDLPRPEIWEKFPDGRSSRLISRMENGVWVRQQEPGRLQKLRRAIVARLPRLFAR